MSGRLLSGGTGERWVHVVAVLYVPMVGDEADDSCVACVLVDADGGVIGCEIAHGENNQDETMQPWETAVL